jgi:hypothetical protein
MAAAIVYDTRRKQWGKQWMLVYFGLYLTAWQFILYILQYTLAAPRASPYDPTGTAIFYGYPSEVGFYTAVLVTFVFEFTFARNIAFSFTYWSALFATAVFVPGFLIWCGFNTWQETLLSVGLGVFSVTLYILVVWIYIIDDLPILLNSSPWAWSGTIDTWLRSDIQIKATEDIASCLVQIERQEPRPRGCGWLWHSLY